MGANVFEVKGDRAQWRMVFDALVDMKIGDTITDDEIAALLPDAAEGSIRGAFYRAQTEMENERKRSFARVRGVGYRMVQAVEHGDLARQQHRKAKRRLKAAHRKAHSADRSLLTQEERQRIDALEINLSRQRDMISRLSGRVEKLDASLKDARRDQKADAAQLSDRVDRLAALLEKHGITEPATT
jgi:hypothetical protein